MSYSHYMEKMNLRKEVAAISNEIAAISSQHFESDTNAMLFCNGAKIIGLDITKVLVGDDTVNLQLMIPFSRSSNVYSMIEDAEIIECFYDKMYEIWKGKAFHEVKMSAYSVKRIISISDLDNASYELESIDSPRETMDLCDDSLPNYHMDNLRIGLSNFAGVIILVLSFPVSKTDYIIDQFHRIPRMVKEVLAHAEEVFFDIHPIIRSIDPVTGDTISSQNGVVTVKSQKKDQKKDNKSSPSSNLHVKQYDKSR